MFYNESDSKCSVCGFIVDEFRLNSDNVCDSCRKEECDECGRSFYLGELRGGICDSCCDKLSREYEREMYSLEQDYWSSRF